MVTLQSIIEMLNPQAAAQNTMPDFVPRGMMDDAPMPTPSAADVANRTAVRQPSPASPPFHGYGDEANPANAGPPDGKSPYSPDMMLRKLIFGSYAPPNLLPPASPAPQAGAGDDNYPDEAARRTAPLGGPQIQPGQVPGTVVGGQGPRVVPPGVPNPFAAPPQQAPQVAPQPRPSPAPMQVGALPAQAAPAAAPAAPNAAGNQFAEFVRALTTGAAAGARPGLSKVGALAAGAGGAVDRIYNEGQAKTKAESAAAKQRFDQTLALRKDTREERGANRADAETTRKNAETESRRKLNESRVNEITEKMKVSAARSGIPGLTVAQAQKLNDQLNQYADKLKSNVTIANDFNQFESLLRKKREELIRDYVAGADAGKGGAPAQGGAPGAPAAAPARPASKADFDALPSGATYVNPADGKVYQKK